ncbi:MAG: hypothetical protein KF776_06450 [Burkholderiales bacterium]|nr:hypothetical protein [Burkholderiales bacterium]
MRTLASAGPWLAAASLGAGIARRDCALIAAAGPLALAAFYGRMDADAPVDAFRAAVRCIVAGAGSLFAAVLLLAAVALAVQGLWLPAHDPHFVGAAVLVASIGALVRVMADEHDAGSGGRLLPLAAAAGGAVLVLGVAGEPSGWATCALPIATAALMGLAGWRLLAEVSTGLLAAGRREW